MKKKTIDRCVIWVLVLGTLLVSLHTCKQEAKYIKRMDSSSTCKLIYLDGEALLIPID